MTLIRSVVLQSLQQECGTLLDLVVLEEHLRNLLNVSLRLSLVSVGDHLSKINRSLGVHRHNLSQDADPVWVVTLLLAVWTNLVKLTSFDQTLDDLIRRTRLLVDAKSHLRVSLSDQVAELIGHGELTLLDPVL